MRWFLRFLATLRIIEARYADKGDMIQKAECIVIVNITQVEKVRKRTPTWSYRQKARATVEQCLKGTAEGTIEIYGMETFICAQCKYETGRFLLFLRKKGDFWVGSNWQHGIRPITDGMVDWYQDEPVSLDDVIQEIEATLETEQDELPDPSADTDG